MTDAEMFIMLRDICVGRTGSWSAREIFEHAKMFGYKARRERAFTEIQAACGDGTLRGRPTKVFPEAPQQVFPEVFPGNTLSFELSVPQKKKKEAKKKKSRDTAPIDTSYLSHPEFGDLEPEIVLFLAVVAAENKSGQITAGRAFALRRELQEALEEIGDRKAFVYGLRAAISAGAGNVNYARKAMKSYTPSVPGGHANGVADDDPELLPVFDKNWFPN